MSETRELDACKNCVVSEPTEDISEITYSVFFCMYTQAVYVHDRADEFSQYTTSAGVKQALEVCRDRLYA
ncbi:hypothetical protein NL676_017315 [Syzygium grande]|nr:hypothetical protein NL676_017315 [Syzygium grande]